MTKYNLKKIEIGYSWRELDLETIEKVKHVLEIDPKPDSRDREITQIDFRHYEIPVGSYSEETINFLREIYPSIYPALFGKVMQIDSGLIGASMLSYVIYQILDRFGGK